MDQAGDLVFGLQLLVPGLRGHQRFQHVLAAFFSLFQQGLRSAGQFLEVFHVALRADLLLVIRHQDDADDDEGAHGGGEQVDRRQRVDLEMARARPHRDTPTKSPPFWRASVCRNITSPRFCV